MLWKIRSPENLKFSENSQKIYNFIELTTSLKMNLSTIFPWNFLNSFFKKSCEMLLQDFVLRKYYPVFSVKVFFQLNFNLIIEIDLQTNIYFKVVALNCYDIYNPEILEAVLALTCFTDELFVKT